MLFSDVLIKEVLPAARALVSKKLVEAYGMSQKQASARLGITQPAISQYKRGLRGNKLDIFNKNPKLLDMVEEIAKGVASGDISKQAFTLELLRLCEYVASEGLIK